jgi:hypothetical protein
MEEDCIGRQWNVVLEEKKKENEDEEGEEENFHIMYDRLMCLFNIRCKRMCCVIYAGHFILAERTHFRRRLRCDAT